MAFDQYQYCPCGNGKKVKFCCSKDIVTELDKIYRALNGEQRVAALDQIDRVMKDKGVRPSLLALKADAQLALDQSQDAAVTIEEFQKSEPYNPVALALSAVMAVKENQTEAAVEKLQRALEYVDQVMPPQVYSAISLVAASLAQDGDILAARGHWLMQTGFAGQQDEAPLNLLMKVNRSTDVPLLLKEDPHYAACPAGVAWSGEFNAAMKTALRGAWLAAYESLSSLDEKVPEEPSILKNMAILAGWLGLTSEAIAACREYASLADVPQQEAVEAEALAQLIAPTTSVAEVDELLIAYPVSDAERLLEHLVSDKRLTQMPVDPHQLAAEGEPPPKAAFWLLDRPAVASNPEIELGDIPEVLGELLLFGKQTDRDARLEFSITANEMLMKKSALSDVVGELAGPPQKEEKIGAVLAISATLTWRWRLPEDVPPGRRRELIEAKYRQVMLEVLPQTRLHALGGMKPAEVAGEPTHHVRLLAAILVLELAGDAQRQTFDFNELRAQLNLPLREEIAAEGPESVLQLPLCRLQLLNPAGLSDEELITAYQRSILKSHQVAILRLAPELLKREQLHDQVSKQDVYRSLIAVCDDPEVGLEYVEAARRVAVSEGQSPVPWLLNELSLRLSLFQAAECNQLIQTIRTRHMEEPGVAESLFQLLVSHGVITPDGRPVGGADPEAALPATAEPPAPEPGKIWTPDAAEGPAGGSKSKLWVPGME